MVRGIAQFEINVIRNSCIRALDINNTVLSGSSLVCKRTQLNKLFDLNIHNNSAVLSIA
jgi:hypothetical protein